MSNEPRSDEELNKREWDAYKKEVIATARATIKRVVAIADEYGVDRDCVLRRFLKGFSKTVCFFSFKETDIERWE